MTDWSEENIRNNCPFCDPHHQTYDFTLESTNYFNVVADTYPLTGGHLLIIPKDHVSCIGEYSDDQYQEFAGLYKRCSQFLRDSYGKVSSFEHGKLGQSVFHSHVQLFPFVCEPQDIVPEGIEHLTQVTEFGELAAKLRNEGGYMFFSIADDKWCVDTALAAPRFFRDRFARAMGHTERGNWKDMDNNPSEMKWAASAKQTTTAKWQGYNE